MRDAIRDILIGAASVFICGLATNAANYFFQPKEDEPDCEDEEEEDIPCPLCCGEGEVSPSKFSVILTASSYPHGLNDE